MTDSEITTQTTQADFWSSHPCGIDSEFLERRRHRYFMEPWLPAYLEGMCTAEPLDCLEVGCGRGTDALELCRHLAPGSRYRAIDYSQESIAVSAQTLQTETGEFPVATIPDFTVGNALHLDFPDDHFDLVYSMGVLHHTPDPARAVEEVRRVLKPGHTCHIFLYRTFSLKVGTARILRGAQRIGDTLTRQERVIYSTFLKDRPPSRSLGTMLHECFGVPFMHSYTRRQTQKLFANFKSVDIAPYGYNVMLRGQTRGENPFGYFWKITATK
tara:strand:+ start:132449 stop:133261 length:813 start_codon:yes stop_codon:yes gene_type:complete